MTGGSKSGVLSSLDVRVKLLCLLAYFIAAFHARSAPALSLCLAVAVACACAARLGVRRFSGVLRPLAPILVITVVMQVLYVQQGPVAVRLCGLAVTWTALATSARMLVCLLCVMVMSVTFMGCTTAEELVFTLRWVLAPLRRLGVRTDAFMFSLSVAFRFVPVLVDEFGQLKRAQEARLATYGGSVRQRLGAYTLLFAPLVRSSFRRADALAEASVSRGFGCGARPTSMAVRKLHARDAVALAVACALSVAVFVL